MLGQFGGAGRHHLQENPAMSLIRSVTQTGVRRFRRRRQMDGRRDLRSARTLAFGRHLSRKSARFTQSARHRWTPSRRSPGRHSLLPHRAGQRIPPAVRLRAQPRSVMAAYESGPAGQIRFSLCEYPLGASAGLRGRHLPCACRQHAQVQRRADKLRNIPPFF